jgi:hypothetical protein
MLELGLVRLAEDVRDLDAPLALMKGSAAAAWVYPESAQRQRSDLDLLVGETLPEVRRALRSRGWSDANDPRHGQDPRAVRAWNLRRSIGGGWVNLDLHRQLVHGDWCRPDVASMLAERVTGRAPLPVTSVADTFANTVVHLVKTGFHEPLKGWIDLVRMLPLVTAGELADRARAHRLVTATWLCLGVLGRWFDADVGAHRRALGRPLQGALVDYLARGEHATPERRPMARGFSYRLWPRLLRDVGTLRHRD